MAIMIISNSMEMFRESLPTRLADLTQDIKAIDLVSIKISRMHILTWCKTCGFVIQKDGPPGEVGAQSISVFLFH
jgi:exonuclease I